MITGIFPGHFGYKIYHSIIIGIFCNIIFNYFLWVLIYVDSRAIKKWKSSLTQRGNMGIGYDVARMLGVLQESSTREKQNRPKILLAMGLFQVWACNFSSALYLNNFNYVGILNHCICIWKISTTSSSIHVWPYCVLTGAEDFKSWGQIWRPFFVVVIFKSLKYFKYK